MILLHLGPLASDPPGELDVLGHDGHPLGVDGAQVGVLEQADKVGLGSLLEEEFEMPDQGLVAQRCPPEQEGPLIRPPSAWLTRPELPAEAT